VPNGKLDKNIKEQIEKTYVEVGDLIEKLEFREAIRKVMELVENGNKFYDEKQPWIAKKENIEEFNDIIYTCTVIIANLSNLFEMVMPTACKKIRKYLKIENPCWNLIEVEPGLKLENIEPLFTRIDKK